PYLHDHGRFYAAHEPADGSDGQRAARERFKAKMAADREAYGRAVVGTMPDPGKGFTDIRPAHGADAVLTFRNIHNWIEHGELDGMLRAFHAVLKPGGVLGVEEHRAPEGTSLDQVMRTGYVPETLVIERANAAGFKLAGKSEVNANPLDTKDHPNGVWSLPPTLRGGATDRARFIAIGESDRMTLKFIKPMA
ncbi:MAG: putative methyltransferase, partial [Rhizobacter sp.]|nr:putative methyltransferase [Rhizobacter sp.]